MNSNNPPSPSAPSNPATPEKIRILRAAAAVQDTPRTKSAIAAIDAALENFTWERGGKGSAHADDVRRASEAIEAATRAVYSNK